MSEEFRGFEVHAFYNAREITVQWGLYPAGTNQIIGGGYTPFINPDIVGAFYIKTPVQAIINDELLFLWTAETTGFVTPQPDGRVVINVIYEDSRPDEPVEYEGIGLDAPDEPPEIVERPVFVKAEGAPVSSENKGIADIWATINDNLVTFFSRQSGSGLMGGADPLGLGGLLGFDIVGAIAPAFNKLVSEGIKANIAASVQATGESTELGEGLGSIFAPFAADYIDALDKLTDVDELGDSALSPESAASKAKTLTGAMAVLNLGLWLAHTVAEVASLGQVEAISELKDMVLDPMGLSSISQQTVTIPVNELLLKPLQQFYAAEFTPEIPEPSELINIVVKEKMSFEDFELNMKYKGFSPAWSKLIWDAHFIAPSYGDIKAAYFRDIIPETELDAMLMRVDLDPDFNYIWKGLMDEIPPYSDIVNMRVKEKMTQADFAATMQALGYGEKWAGLIWDSHFIPPSLGDGLTAWRRDIIDETELDALMERVDLDPEFKEIFDTRKYGDPSVTMGRFMFETGAISVDRVTEIVKRAGYLVSDIQSITNFIVGFQERRWRTRYLMQLQRAFERGLRTEREFRDEVKDAHYTDGVADWMIETSNLRLEMRGAAVVSEKPKIISLGDLKKLYQLDKIDEDRYRQDLLLRGYELGDIDLLITLENQKKSFEEAGGKKVALTQSELLNAWKFEEVTEDYLRTELLLRGLNLSELDILINTKKKQWGII